MADLRARFQLVAGTLEALALETNRPAAKLVAVSKTVPPAVIAEAYALGHRVFGENYAHELMEKAPQLPQDIAWHYIGTLQSNKVKALIERVPNLACVESVNSVKLANLLNKTWGSVHPGTRLSVLVQINTSAEESKDGVDPTEGPALVQHLVSECPNLVFRGLMTIGKPGDMACFDALAQLRESIINELKLPADLELSMGMSGDYAEAVRRGATSVRCGSVLFGVRPPKA